MKKKFTKVFGLLLLVAPCLMKGPLTRGILFLLVSFSSSLYALPIHPIWTGKLLESGGGYVQPMTLTESVKGSVYSVSYAIDAVGGKALHLQATDKDGSLAWHKVIRSRVACRINALAADAADNLYMIGYFMDRIQVGQDTLEANGYWDAFVLKVSPSGDMIWIKQLRSNNKVFGNAIKVDGTGTVYVAGNFEGCLAIEGLQPFCSKGRTDVFLMKLDRDGEVLWHRTEGRPGLTTQLNVMELDANGNIYYSGYTEGALARRSLFVTKLHGDAGKGWTIYPMPGVNSQGQAIAVSRRSDMIYLAGALSEGNSGKRAARTFLMALDPSGQVNWQNEVEGIGQVHTLSVINRHDQDLVAVGGGRSLEDHSGTAISVFDGPELVYSAALSTGRSLSRLYAHDGHYWLLEQALEADTRSASATLSADLKLSRYDIGVNDRPAAGGLHPLVYPNPAADELFVELDADRAYLTLYNVQGSACMEKPLQRGKQAVDISGLPSGTYMLLLRDKYGKTFYTEKLVKL